MCDGHDAKFAMRLTGKGLKISVKYNRTWTGSFDDELPGRSASFILLEYTDMVKVC